MTHALAIRDQATDTKMPATVDKSALKTYLTLLEDPETLQLQNRLAAAYDAACTALIGPNDVQVEGSRSFKKKSAWKKLARYFNISTTVLTQDERFLIDASTGESVFIASCTVRATSPWGQVADAVGACSTDEETGRRKITIADAIATAETRASNRGTSNLIAMGEVSAEEASREDRENVVRKSVQEMSLDEARLVVFPWRHPEKYRNKVLGELSFKMLVTVLTSVTAEIEKSGENPRRLEVKRAAELLTDGKRGPATDAQLSRIGALVVSVDINDEARTAIDKEVADTASPMLMGRADEIIARLESLVPKGEQAQSSDANASASEAGEARSQSQSPQSASATPPVSAPSAAEGQPSTGPTPAGSQQDQEAGTGALSSNTSTTSKPATTTPTTSTPTSATAKPTKPAAAVETPAPAAPKDDRPWNTQGASDLGF